MPQCGMVRKSIGFLWI